MRAGKPWIGDQVYDHEAERNGIITDVQGGTYVLRPLAGGGAEWTAPSDEKLSVSVPRPERIGWLRA
ncbi:hypothetical protein OG258_20055 [Streptomyces mirabilis]|uniref:hypothetical protein n=1 Tax=Streptomyces mirabilis TaxID=68239 RepID=UPI002E29D4EF|nr:hypothetical protein [Streptomyces mirabilis]